MNFDDIDMSSFPPYQVPPFRMIYPHVPNPDEVAAIKDFSTVCRLCAKVTFHVYPIFSGVGLDYDFAGIIDKHLQLKVDAEDGLPGAVCVQCARALAGWPALRRAARLADGVLRRRLGLLPPETKPSESAGSTSEDGKYVDAATDPRPPLQERVCSLCPLTIPARRYNNHMVAMHSDKVFRCDECHCYLNNEDMLFHLSNHARSDSTMQKYYTNEANKKRDEAEQKRRDDIDRKKLEEYKRKREEITTIKVEELRIKNLNSIPILDFSKMMKMNEKGREKPIRIPLQNENRPDETIQIANLENSPPNKQKRNKKDSAIKINKKTNESSDKGNGPIIPKDDEGHESLDEDADEDDNEGTDETKPLRATPKAKASEPVKKKEKGTEKSPKASRTCPICGKEYRASSSYFYHMKYFHKRSRDHECEVCGKKFGTKANLAQHASVHTGAYDLECKECGKRFRSKPSLYIHEQSHGGVKRWACGQCERSFRWRTHLARHVQRHAAQRAHVCGTCGRGFSVRCDLLRHARTHAAAEFHCAACGLKFAQKRYLKVHMIKKHSEAPAVVTRS